MLQFHFTKITLNNKHPITAIVFFSYLFDNKIFIIILINNFLSITLKGKRKEMFYLMMNLKHFIYGYR